MIVEAVAPEVLWAVPTEDRVLALTIDDGPSSHTAEILEVLAEHDAGATFFVIGGRVEFEAHGNVRPPPLTSVSLAIEAADSDSMIMGAEHLPARADVAGELTHASGDAAWAAGMEDEVGTLSVGKRADFVIVDRDPLTAPAEELWGTRVLRTVIDGETVYEAAP